MSRFTAFAALQVLEDARGRPLLKGGRCTWRLLARLPYEVGEEGSGETITVPAGAETDLASIPSFAWSIGFPPDGPWLKAAIVHDFLYRTRGACDLDSQSWRTRAEPYSRKEADKILREGMKVLGVGAFERTVIYNAVRLGGEGGWGQ